MPSSSRATVVALAIGATVAAAAAALVYVAKRREEAAEVDAANDDTGAGGLPSSPYIIGTEGSQDRRSRYYFLNGEEGYTAETGDTDTGDTGGDGDPTITTSGDGSGFDRFVDRTRDNFTSPEGLADLGALAALGVATGGAGALARRAFRGRSGGARQTRQERRRASRETSRAPRRATATPAPRRAPRTTRLGARVSAAPNSFAARVRANVGAKIAPAAPRLKKAAFRGGAALAAVDLVTGLGRYVEARERGASRGEAFGEGFSLVLPEQARNLAVESRERTRTEFGAASLYTFGVIGTAGKNTVETVGSALVNPVATVQGAGRQVASAGRGISNAVIGLLPSTRAASRASSQAATSVAAPPPSSSSKSSNRSNKSSSSNQAAKNLSPKNSASGPKQQAGPPAPRTVKAPKYAGWGVAGKKFKV